MESLLLDEVARHAAMLEFAQHAEGALLRQGARELGQLLSACGGATQLDADGVLAAAATNKSIDLLTRYRRAHEKALYKALGAIREQPTSRDGRPPIEENKQRPGCHFSTETSCEVFLQTRFQRPSWRCPACGSKRGYWLPSRGRWECAKCQRQIGLRSGTVMEGSHLPLVKWFGAVECIVCSRHLTVAQVAETIRIARTETVRCMLVKIRAALDDARRSELLAGLDTFFAARRP